MEKNKQKLSLKKESEQKTFTKKESEDCAHPSLSHLKTCSRLGRLPRLFKVNIPNSPMKTDLFRVAQRLEATLFVEEEFKCVSFNFH